MTEDEKLDMLIRMVRSLANDVEDIKARLIRMGIRDSYDVPPEEPGQVIVPTTGTWTEPEDTGTPYRIR